VKKKSTPTAKPIAADPPGGAPAELRLSAREEMVTSTASPSGKPAAQSKPPYSTGPPVLAGDLLIGAGEIAKFLYGNPRRRRAVYHLYETGGLPTFKLGGQLCARKSTLVGFVKAREGAALATLLSEQTAAE
jgi:hypothetical protein